jgi:transposase-like protein
LAVKSWIRNWDELSTCFNYPPEIRRLIYTTNIIEAFHRQLRKATKSKAALPNDDALIKILYLVTMDVTEKWTVSVKNWGLILSQLIILFKERIEPYL